jgi:outer membrane protein OmpA-like peptidoglycan-associated protein
VLLSLLAAGCQLLPDLRREGEILRLPVGRPAVLMVILGPPSWRTRSVFRGMVTGTVRPGEHLLVVSAAGGGSLGSFVAPRPPAMPGPAFPKPPPPSATSFQKATYRGALSRARAALRRDKAVLRAEQRRQLRAWAERSVSSALAADGAGGGGGSLGQALAAVAADAATLRQTGLSFGRRDMVVVVGSEAAVPPAVHASLAGLPIAIADVPAASDGAAWQADLVGAGASNSFPLTGVTQGRLASAVAAGLASRAPVAFPIPGIRYGPARYRLPASAVAGLRRALYLLTVSYPDSTASIVGYTDNVAVPGGNRLLSWRRAETVLKWLTAHGVPADRLQAFGYGASDPVAPNGSAGQPLNRRVVLIVSLWRAA